MKKNLFHGLVLLSLFLLAHQVVVAASCDPENTSNGGRGTCGAGQYCDGRVNGGTCVAMSSFNPNAKNNAAPAVPETGAAQQCSQYTGVTAYPAGKGCDASKGSVAVDNACCSAGVPAGGICCGKASATVGTGSTDNSTAFVALTNIPLIDQAGNSATFPNFLNQLYKICIGLAAVLAVLQIIRAGIMYMGGDSVTEKSAARSLIVQSLLGLLLVLSPVIVFSIINPSILSLQIGSFDQLAIPNPANSFAGAPNPALCQSYDPSKFKTFIPQAMAGASVCKDTLGSGYVKTDAMCCNSTDPAAICCGYDASQVPVAPPVTSTGAYHYLALVGDSDSHPTCATEFPSSNFKTLALCTADMNTTVKSGTKAVTQDCSGKVANSPTTVYSKLSKLPGCQ